MANHVCVIVSPSKHVLNQVEIFHENWYGHHAIDIMTTARKYITFLLDGNN
jgi:hypothetical protein